MFVNQILKLVVCPALLLSFSSVVTGQSTSEPEKPKKPPMKKLDGGSIGSIGIVGSGENETGEKQPDPGTRKGLAGKSKDSLTDQNGKRTIQIRQGSGRITVFVTRRYSPAEHHLLVKKHPELAEYIELFPKTIDDAEIGLSLEIKKKYTARDEVELKNKHPDIYQLFRRYRNRLGSR